MSRSLASYMGFINASADNIAAFLRDYVADIEQHYNWEFKEDVVPAEVAHGLAEAGNCYRKTLQLKANLIARLNACETFEERLPFGKYFVENWGGVGTNKDLADKLRDYDELADLRTINTLGGVSTWSKYLSLRNPDAAIYDSRVAYAINAINYLAETTSHFFPMPAGRSSRLALLDIETLFVIASLQRSEVFIADNEIAHKQIAAKVRKKFYLPEDITYIAYLALLEAVAERLELPLDEKNKVEMLLFALAPTVIFSRLVASFRAEPQAAAGRCDAPALTEAEL